MEVKGCVGKLYRSCLEVIGGVWKSWVICGSHKWSVQGLTLMTDPQIDVFYDSFRPF